MCSNETCDYKEEKLNKKRIGTPCLVPILFLFTKVFLTTKIASSFLKGLKIPQ